MPSVRTLADKSPYRVNCLISSYGVGIGQRQRGQTAQSVMFERLPPWRGMKQVSLAVMQRLMFFSGRSAEKNPVVALPQGKPGSAPGVIVGTGGP